MAVTLADIESAARRIAPLVHRTPLLESAALSGLVGAEVQLKLESFQPTGSFKVRGAANKLLQLTDEERARGVVAVSTGNHGRAVAFVAKQLGIQATICISNKVPSNKVAALEQLATEVVIHGDSQDEAEVKAKELVRERGASLIHPFDDPHIIAGQGTIGLELLADFPELDTVLVPLSGGGLIAGIALALKTLNPKIRVVGISAARAPVMLRSLQAGKPVEIPEESTLADSLQGGIGLDNCYTFALVRDYVDDILLLSEEDIAAGMIFAMREEGVVLEGAGAVGIAALLQQRSDPLGKTVAIVVSGRNVSLETLANVIRAERGPGARTERK